MSSAYFFIILSENPLPVLSDKLLVESLVWNLVAGALYGIISVFLENLCGLSAPIIPDEPEEQELRERVEAQSFGMVRSVLESGGAQQLPVQTTEGMRSGVRTEEDKSLSMEELGKVGIHGNVAPNREAEE